MSREEKIIIIFLTVLLAVTSIARELKKTAEEPTFIHTSALTGAVKPQDKSPRSVKSAASKFININKAEALELQALKGIGPVLALRIIRFREENGHFKRIEDLQKVKGIGPKKLQDIKEWAILK